MPENNESAVYLDGLEYALGVPFVPGNRLTLLQNGNEIFPSMLGAIESAKHSVDFETFVYWRGDIAEQFARALALKASEGKTVRVLLDAYGARTIAEHLIELLVDAGVDLRWFRPLSTWRLWRIDKRSHRKILVVDDLVGFTGGVGIAQEWMGDARNPDEWRETHLRLDGPAVSGLKAAFLENWNESGSWTWQLPEAAPAEHADGDQVQIVRASATIGWTGMATLLHSLVSVSRESLTLVTAYFVPDPRLVDLLCDAAARGVHVRILLPGRYTDSRLSQLAGQLSLDALLECGVRVWLYDRTVLHAKLVAVDSSIVCVGSANINHRSMGKDEECCAVALSKILARQIEARFEMDCEHARSLVLGEWRRRSLWTRLKERSARLLVEHL